MAVTRFVNNLMLDGKKSIAYTIFYDALELVGKKMKDADKSPLEVWKQALENITPQVEVKIEAYRWRDIPGSYGGSSGAQDFDFYEKPCPLLPQARRQNDG